MSESIKNLTWECYRLPGVSKPGEWSRLIERQLNAEGCPYSYDVTDYALRIWRIDSSVTEIAGSPYSCRNAFRIERVAFGGSSDDTLIGISIARVFFEEGISSPILSSTDKLFQKGKYPPVLRHQPMLEGISDLVMYLACSPELSELEIHKDFDAIDLSSDVIYQTSDGKKNLLSLTRGDGLSKNLLNLVRNNVALQPVTIRLGLWAKVSKRSDASTHIAERVVRVLREWGCAASWKELASSEAVEEFIADANQFNLVLVPLEGKIGDRPPENALGWIRYLDSENVAFQLCSTSSNPIYSQHGLAMMILQKAGGVHFSTRPATGESFGNTWFVGLDLGRGGQRAGRIAAITLTDSNGSLKAYWRALKDKTESLPLDVLSHGLRWIVDQADELDPSRHLVLIRDGRCPIDENVDHYKTAMGQRSFTFVEYVKGGNPLIHISLKEPNPGTILIPELSPFVAMYACLDPHPGMLSRPIKFRIRLNPDQFSKREVGEMLTSLCHSATLSYQPSRIPAPLQWSNGLAKLSFTDLQFSGWTHLPHHKVDLR